MQCTLLSLRSIPWPPLPTKPWSFISLARIRNPGSRGPYEMNSNKPCSISCQSQGSVFSYDPLKDLFRQRCTLPSVSLTRHQLAALLTGPISNATHNYDLSDVLVFTFITLLILAIRFTSDLDALDKTIPVQMADLIYCSAQIISVLVLLRF